MPVFFGVIQAGDFFNVLRNGFSAEVPIPVNQNDAGACYDGRAIDIGV